jgi:dolichol-phosphate mannosyltransferase
MRISVVIPTKNEAENLKRIVPKVKNILGKDLLEIIAANSPCKDNTEEVAAQLEKEHPEFKLLPCPPGMGASLKIAYAAAKGDWILSIDADFLQNDKDIKNVIAKAKQGYDGVIGSRYIPGGGLRGYPFLKKMANRTYHLFIRHVLGIPVNDLTNNFKLYKAEIMKSVPITEPHFAANAETGLYPALQGYTLAEVPVMWIQRQYGTSTFSVAKLAYSYGRALLRALWRKHILRTVKNHLLKQVA